MIAGLQKMTLLDYPGRVACTVFLQGCNFRCPFCHNSELLDFSGQPLMDEDTLLAFLQKRKGLLDGVCITGGEPTLYPGLEILLKRIKALGYAIKLDTNGSRADVLKRLVSEHLVDYVAMDIKNSPAQYAETCGLPHMDLTGVSESIAFLLSDTIDYEFRTTLVSQLHDAATIAEMGCWLGSFGKKPKKLFLQSFVDRDTVLFSGFEAPSSEQLAQYVDILSPYVEQVIVRGK